MAGKKNDYHATTLFIFFLIGIILFLGYRLSNVGSSDKNKHLSTPPLIFAQKQNDIRNDLSRCGGGNAGGDPLSNAYVPPIKCDAGGLMNNPVIMNIPMNSIGINVPTQQYNVQYTQVGILTKRYGNNNEILPLMGRRTITSRNKWQYYTVSGGGGINLQAKLPVKVKGKTGSSEYGCEEVTTGDDVYVEGFQDTFQATIYESGMFSYIPY